LIKERGCAEGETPEQRTLDVVAGWNKPAEPKAEKAVESVRNAADGKAAGTGSPEARTPVGDTAMRDREPQGRRWR
jgi:hypothetical protein